MRKVKRYSKIIISCISLICVLAVSALSTYARSDEPYYDYTFQMLNHKNIRSSIMMGTNVQYISGWFKTQTFTFNKTEPFMMVAYYTDAFKQSNNDLGFNDNDSHVYAQIGVMESGLSGLKVEAGGILDIKFDWYYNIRVDVGIDRSGAVTGGMDDLPVTALSKNTRMLFSSSASVDSSGKHQWFNIPGVEIKNHGIYNDVDSDRSSALYWSTVHFRFYNDTDQTLEFELFEPHYDVVSGWKEPQYADYVKDNFGGVYPKSDEVGSVKPSSSRSYVYMGYKANVLPSYKIVAGKGASNFETEQSIQNATDSIVEELGSVSTEIKDAVADSAESINKNLDELGIGIAGGFNDLESSIDKDIKDSTSEIKNKLGSLDTSVNKGLDDLGDQIGDDLDNAVGSADIDKDPFAGTNSAIEDQHDQENEVVSDLQGNADKALEESGLLDKGSFSTGISSLYKTLEIVGVSFDKILKAFGTEFNVAVTYAIVGGIVITLLGVSSLTFVHGTHVKAGVKERQAASSRDKRIHSQWVRYKIDSYVDD